MLAIEAKEPFDSDAHLFEIKWDGIRCLAFIERGGLRQQ
jgi:ATP-dependent DNA ligase